MRLPDRSPHATTTFTDVVHDVVDIAAPPEAVFEALTDPHELAAWLGDSSAGPDDAPIGTASSVVAPGQRWRAPAVAPDGTAGSVRGEYLRVVAPYLLESTWSASWDGEPALAVPDTVRFELVPIDVGGAPGTRLTVIHTRTDAPFQVTALQGMFVAGGDRQWPRMLSRLEVHVAARPGIFA